MASPMQHENNTELIIIIIIIIIQQKGIKNADYTSMINPSLEVLMHVED